MNVSLTPQLEMFVGWNVREDLCSTASEVVREGLLQMNERDEERRARLDALWRAVAIGLAQVDKDQGVLGEQLVARIRSQFKQAESVC